MTHAGEFVNDARRTRRVKGLDRLANLATVIVAVCAAAIAMRAYVSPSSRPTNAMQAAEDTTPIANWEDYTVGGWTVGPDSAKITILEFGDYECPFCARFAREIDAVLAAFPNEIRFVYRHWPLENHRLAYPAARAAECAGAQGSFWGMHRLLYEKRDSLGLIPFAEFGRRLGVKDAALFKACVLSPERIPRVEQGIRDAREIGGRGTPAVVINGVLMRRLVDSSVIAGMLAKTYANTGGR
jgi:protein-disulfide isomerase